MFFKRLRSTNDILEAVDASYRAIASTKFSLLNSFRSAKAEGVDVKGTAWIASCNYAPPSDLRQAWNRYESLEIHNLVISIS